MFAQVDEQVHCHVIMDEIMDPRTDGTQVSKDYEFLL